MDEDSNRIMSYVRDNFSWFTDVCIGESPRYHGDGIFNSHAGGDFTTLGQYIATNTYITYLEINIDNIYANIATNRGLYDGIKSNSSITSLNLGYDDDNPNLRIADEILQACQVNKNLTRLDISCYNLNSVNDLQQNGGDTAISATLNRCANLTHITLYSCRITDEHFLPMVEAMREHNSVEELCLSANLIGNTGGQALATLLEDSNCNLHTLELKGNQIGIIGVKAIANALSNNTKLKKLNLHNNPIDQPITTRIEDRITRERIFYKVVCDKTSVNSTFSSNHTIEEILSTNHHLTCLLGCNKYLKEYAAINKIFHCHPNIDMEPFFEMGIEDSERNLKGLPYVIDWFERAKEAVLDISFIKNGVVKGRETFSNVDARIPLVDTRKLSAMYQFALAMPLLFVPASPTKADDKKRKRGKGAADS